LLARHGVWSFCFGDTQSCDDGLAGFWEVACGRPQSRSGMMVLGETPALDKVIYASSARTDPYSFCRNRENLLRKSAEFGLRAMRNLYRGGAETAAETVAPAAHAGKLEPTAYPCNLRMALIIARMSCRLAGRAVQKLFYVDQWVLAYRFGADADIKSAHGFVPLLPPKDRFWADPFPFEKDGRYFVFFEELMFDTKRGHISVLEIGRDGAVSTPVKVLQRDYHLSYPFIFEWEGALYMIPETGENRTVELYRCATFPNRWVFDCVLIDNIRAVDATLHQISGRWWMFVNVSPDGVEIYDELHLYHADSPFGPWLPHKRNPVISDVMQARPAGRLFERDGMLFRPAQICAPIYGAGLLINQIVSITPDEYMEKRCESVLPGKTDHHIGIHTLNKAGQLALVDQFVRRRRYFS
jgi:hypothetical protein